MSRWLAVNPAFSLTRTEGMWATYTATSPVGVLTVERIARVQPILMSTGRLSLISYLDHRPTVPCTEWYG